MYRLLRPLWFCLDPETSHDLALRLLAKVSANKLLTALCRQRYANRVPLLAVHAMGIKFPNPLGLAAGLDKQATCANALAAIGFGWIELGTVTPMPQPGNHKPRLFRLRAHDAIINRMGFNSIGLKQFLQNIHAGAPEVIKGINIGKNATTPIADAAADYLHCLRAVYRYADYIAVNISSPNTSDLRSLQQNHALDALLAAIHTERLKLGDQHGRGVPLVVKIAPDLQPTQLDEIAGLLRKYQIDGVAATNTSVARGLVSGHRLAQQQGGLSGPAIAAMSNQVIARLYQNLQGEIPIIGVGGINSATAAIAKLQAGADLLQLYTGFIYQGPALVRQIIQQLAAESAQSGFASYVRGLRANR